MAALAVDPGALRAWLVAVLGSAGWCAEEADALADHALWAELSDIPSQGLWRLGKYLRKLRSGGFARQPSVRECAGFGAYVLLDGGDHSGPYVAALASERAIRLALDQGLGLVSVRHSNHFGAAGYYAERIAASGLVGLVLTNCAPRLASPQTGRRITGNNVIAIAAPSSEGPVVLDTCVGTSSGGRLVMAAERGTALEPGLVDDAARVSDMSSAAEAGILPIGAHKGFALALGIEILCGAVAGGAILTEIKSHVLEPGERAGVSHLFLALDPGRGLGRAPFTARMDEFVALLQARGEHVPGLARGRARAARAGRPLVLDDRTADLLREWSAEFGLAPPW